MVQVCNSDRKQDIASVRDTVQGFRGGQYFRFQPTLRESVDLNETDPIKLIGLVWTAKVYGFKRFAAP